MIEGPGTITELEIDDIPADETLSENEETLMKHRLGRID